MLLNVTLHLEYFRVFNFDLDALEDLLRLMLLLRVLKLQEHLLILKSLEYER